VRNTRLTLEFDGRRYAGWQFQPHLPTVQCEIQQALGRITHEATTVYGCGRTDAGVSARGYVANFHTGTNLAPERLRLALNAHLPDDIRCLACEDVPESFNARFSARSKTYVYHILRGVSPLRRAHAWEFRFALDAAKMRDATGLFAGSKDFQPFCQTRDADGTCNVLGIGVTEFGDEITVAVSGDRFLYKMVRRIVGALVTFGAGRVTKSDLKAALAGRPHQPFQTAPAQGLILDSVEY
jgi:tRNA pseudouridine38-40 synthase